MRVLRPASLPVHDSAAKPPGVAELPSERRTRAWQAFLDGLTKPSRGATAATLATVFVGFAICAITFTEGFVAGPFHRYLAWGRTDTQLEVTSRALAVRSMELDGPAVFILGSSGIREAISNSEDLQGLLGERSPDAPVVCNLSSFDQTTVEMFALADMLPEKFDGVVLLGINPCDVGAGPQQHHAGAKNGFDLRFGFRSPAVDAEAIASGHDLPPVTGNYFVDNYRFFLPRLPYLFRNLAFGVPEEEHHPWAEIGGPIDENGWDLQAERVKRLVDDYHAQLNKTLDYYARMINDLKTRGDVKVVLLESPICPRCIEETIGEPFWEQHVANMSDFAERSSVRYWNLNDEAGLTNDDFYDYVHIFNPDAQMRYTTALSEELLTLFTPGKSDRRGGRNG